MTASSEQEDAVSAGCLCGAVRYKITGDLRGVVNCHCSKCRQFHGHFGAYTRVKRDALILVEQRGLKWFHSTTDETSNVHRGFCAECGASLFWHPKDQDQIAVAAGSLDDPSGLKTIGHVWLSQKSAYYHIHDDLPRFAKGWDTR